MSRIAKLRSSVADVSESVRVSVLSDVEEAMRQHPAACLQFFRDSSSFLATPRDASVFAHQLKHYVLGFPLIFLRALGQVTDEQIRVVLVENLYEEHGEGRIDHTHPNLYRRFLAALPLPPIDPRLPQIDALLEAHERCASTGSQFQVAGFMMANEYIAPIMLSRIDASLSELGLSAEARRYFSLHATLDLYHHRRILDVLVDHLNDPVVAPEIMRGVSIALDPHVSLWPAIGQLILASR